MTEVFKMVSLDDLVKDGFRSAMLLANRRAKEKRIMEMFSSREEARAMWDEWDGVSPGGEEAHYYLNLIGDGKYCAV